MIQAQASMPSTPAKVKSQEAFTRNLKPKISEPITNDERQMTGDQWQMPNDQRPRTIAQCVSNNIELQSSILVIFSVWQLSLGYHE